MILEHIENWKRYSVMHSGFEAAFSFLRRKEIADLSAGRHPIDGDRLYALVVKEDGRGKDKARLEAHRLYIDIQFTLKGQDEIGWKPVFQAKPDDQGYNPDKDIVFFTDKPDAWVLVPHDTFAVFFPEDAHAPLGGAGAIHKLVVKVAL